MDGRMEKRVGGGEGRRGREPVRRPVRPVEEETRLADPRYHDAGDYVSDHEFFQKEPPAALRSNGGKTEGILMPVQDAGGTQKLTHALHKATT